MNNGNTCFLQALFGQSCKTFLDIIASPNWTKLQSLDWQLSCQSNSHCRPYLVVTARGMETEVREYPKVCVNLQTVIMKEMKAKCTAGIAPINEP